MLLGDNISAVKVGSGGWHGREICIKCVWCQLFWLQLLNEIKDLESKVLHFGTSSWLVVPAFQCVSGRREGGFVVLWSGELEKWKYQKAGSIMCLLSATGWGMLSEINLEQFLLNLRSYFSVVGQKNWHETPLLILFTGLLIWALCHKCFKAKGQIYWLDHEVHMLKSLHRVSMVWSFPFEPWSCSSIFLHQAHGIWQN